MGTALSEEKEWQGIIMSVEHDLNKIGYPMLGLGWEVPAICVLVPTFKIDDYFLYEPYQWLCIAKKLKETMLKFYCLILVVTQAL